MFFRYSLRTTRFVDVWLDTINADPEYWDQNAFNDLARAGWDPVNKVCVWGVGPRECGCQQPGACWVGPRQQGKGRGGLYPRPTMDSYLIVIN